MLAGLWFLARWLLAGELPALLAGAAALCVAGAAHHVYGALAIASAAGVWLLWRLPAGRNAQGLAARTVPFGGACLAAGLVLFPTLLAFRAAGYAPPLDAAAFSFPGAWAYATREATAAWTLVTAAGAAALWRGRSRPSAGWLLAAALLLVAAPATLLSAEPRLVPAVSIAAALGIAATVGRPDRLTGAAMAAVALFLAVVGDRAAGSYAAFYRVLDRSMLAAVEAVAAANPEGLVAVRADRRGWPVGWWYEGLTEERIAVGSDPRWLGFPGERERAAMAADLFAPGTTGADLRRRAAAAGVELLVASKWDWIGWERWLGEPDPAVEAIFDDGETLVLRLRPPPPAPGAQNAGV